LAAAVGGSLINAHPGRDQARLDQARLEPARVPVEL
jgi:hypothetical protein